MPVKGSSKPQKSGKAEGNKAKKREIKEGITRTTCRHRKKRPFNTNNIPPPKPPSETNIHAKWSKSRGIYLNHETKVHNQYPNRLCRIFFRAKSFDFQAGDAPSTLGAFRLWFDFQTRSTLAAGCKTAHPDRSTFQPGGCSPGRPTAGQNVSFECIFR